MILQNLLHNAETAQRVVKALVERLPADRTCGCATALASAIITRPEAVPAGTRRKLAPIVGKYLS